MGSTTCFHRSISWIRLKKLPIDRSNWRSSASRTTVKPQLNTQITKWCTIQDLRSTLLKEMSQEVNQALKIVSWISLTSWKLNQRKRRRSVPPRQLLCLVVNKAPSKSSRKVTKTTIQFSRMITAVMSHEFKNKRSLISMAIIKILRRKVQHTLIYQHPWRAPSKIVVRLTASRNQQTSLCHSLIQIVRRGIRCSLLSQRINQAT